MAIVQLSRIQHRRGRKLAGSGMPQLASGELGWAIDTQELYIGNGAVSEGAPAVGNTKVLTEHDNLFDLADQYTYKAGTLVGTVSRSLQSRLDDVVSVKAFGASGDALAGDQTAAFQTAVNSLYKPLVSNLDDNEKVVLYIPEGTYNISAPIEIPSYVTIVGAGKEKTVIKSTVSSVFRTIKRTSDLTVTTATQPKYIEISNMTIEVPSTTYPAIEMVSCEYSQFKNLKFKGAGTTADNFDSSLNHAAIDMGTFNGILKCQFNIFENIEFDGFNTAIKCLTVADHNTVKLSVFKNLNIGVWLGSVGSNIGPNYNTIESSVFDVILREGILVDSGEYNTSKSNKYLSVGNNGGAQTQNLTSVIKFSGTTNVSDLDYFERTELTLNRKDDPSYGQLYVPEVSGRTNYRNLYASETSIGQRTDVNSDTADLLKFPFIERGTITVDYVYEYLPPAGKENDYILREGKLEITCNSVNDRLILNEDYTFTGDTSAEGFLKFSVFRTAVAGSEIVVLRAVNPHFYLRNNDRFYYTIRTKS